MVPLIAAILGAFTGAAKNIGETNKSNRQIELASKTARYSPWTGLKPREVESPDAIGNIAGGAASGMALGQNIQQANSFNDWMKRRAAILRQREQQGLWGNISETGGMNS